jgi:hypothetical protein
LFPVVCAEAQNGFVTKPNCFVGTWRRNIGAEKLNDFRVEGTKSRRPAFSSGRTRRESRASGFLSGMNALWKAGNQMNLDAASLT